MEFLIILGDVEFTVGEENCRRVLLNEFESSSLNRVCVQCGLPTVAEQELYGSDSALRVCLNRKCALFREEQE